MTTHVREYVVATDLADAVRLLQQPDTAPWVASPRMPEVSPAPVLVDLQRLNLDRVERLGKALRLGGQAPLEAVATDALAAGLANGVLAEAARLAAHRGLRNLATVQGALSDSDGPPELLLALAALGASALVYSAAGEVVAEVYSQLPDGALLLEINVPLNPAAVGALARVARTPLDQAIVAAVAVADAENVTVAVSSEAGAFNMMSTPLAGVALDEVNRATLADSLAQMLADDVSPVGDYRGSAAYRTAMVQQLARRVLTQVLQEVARA
jgi:CO/xanthine dehydrogenase FAD-binding subunit